MKHRQVMGRILYTSRKPEMMNQRRGEEWFNFTFHADGKTTFRAHCHIEEPAPTVMRDVVYSVDEHRRPMDCLLRLTIGDAFMGAGFFRFGDGFIECESYGPSIGRLSQRVDLKAPIDGFGTHPIVGDAFLLGAQDWSVSKRKTLNVYVPSPDHRGATPPFLAPVKIDGLYLGTETVTVAAGTFRCKHVQFIDPGDSGMSGEHPPYDIWVTDDADALFIQGGVGGYMKTWYELVELQR